MRCRASYKSQYHCQRRTPNKIDKCVFEQSEESFLGFIVSGQSIQMDPAKAQDIVDWPRPTNHISRKIFSSGKMALSEWMRSVRAIRDTLVADYSTPGINAMRRVVSRPPIAVSAFIRVLSVSYFKLSLWRCGQL